MKVEVTYRLDKRKENRKLQQHNRRIFIVLAALCRYYQDIFSANVLDCIHLIFRNVGFSLNQLFHGKFKQ